MEIATLGIITRENQILLGRNKRGFAKGKLNGPGGKMEPKDQTILDCVMREVNEEAGITLVPFRIEKCAMITFFAAGVPDFEVHVYRTDYFFGEPRETESMVPAWYNIDKLPVDEMLESDRVWFPQLIHGKKFNAKVYYRERMKSFVSMDLLPFTE